MEDLEPVLLPGKHGHLIEGCALLRVCRQLRSEFRPSLYFNLPTITAVVYDFDYRHVVSFINKLGEHELSALAMRSGNAMTLEVHVAPVGLYHYKLPASGALEDTCTLQLRSWSKRLQHPTKKGTHLTMGYQMFGQIRDLAWWWNTLEDFAGSGRFKNQALRQLKDMATAIEARSSL